MTSITNVIAGESIPPRGGQSYVRKDPVCPSRTLEEYALSGEVDVDVACDAAAAAYGAWRATPVLQRGAVLTKAAGIIRERENDLVALLRREIAKTSAEAVGEIRAAANLLDMYGNEALRYGGETLGSQNRDTHLYTVRSPVGVIGVITPWNYPISIPAWKFGPALLCGNTVVWKPSLQHPRSSLAFIQILTAAGLPTGVANLVHGDGSLGAYLTAKTEVAAISFTGSRAVGDKIHVETAQRHAPALCEMGGKNALVVMPDADLRKAATCAINGGLSFGGQKCTGTDRVIIHRDIAGEFRKVLLDAVKRLKVGDPGEDGIFCGPQVDEPQFRRVVSMLEDAHSNGDAKRLCGGPRRTDATSLLIDPTILDEVDPQSPIAREEIFGPVLALFECADIDDAIRQVNTTEYGLSASICTNNLRHAFRFAEGVETGLAYVNRPTSGAEFHAPFGGIKASGHGPTEQGLKVLEFYSHWRTIAMQFDS